MRPNLADMGWLGPRDGRRLRRPGRHIHGGRGQPPPRSARSSRRRAANPQSLPAAIRCAHGDSASLPQPAEPERRPLEASWDHGLWFESADKQFRVHVGGNAQVDSTWLIGPNGVVRHPRRRHERDRERVRRPSSAGSACGSTATIYDQFDYIVEYDFANATTRTTACSRRRSATSPAPRPRATSGCRSATCRPRQRPRRQPGQADRHDATTPPGVPAVHGTGRQHGRLLRPVRQRVRPRRHRPQLDRIRAGDVAVRRLPAGDQRVRRRPEQGRVRRPGDRAARVRGRRRAAGPRRVGHVGRGTGAEPTAGAGPAGPAQRAGVTPSRSWWTPGNIPGSRQYTLAPEFAAVYGPWTFQAEWTGQFLTRAIAGRPTAGHGVLPRRLRRGAVLPDRRAPGVRQARRGRSAGSFRGTTTA